MADIQINPILSQILIFG